MLSATNPDENALAGLVFAHQRALATQSAQGIFRSAGHLDHGKVLNDPTVSRLIVDLTRTIVIEARGGARSR